MNFIKHLLSKIIKIITTKNKYKRCTYMAQLCYDKWNYFKWRNTKKYLLYSKWETKWRELSKQFK